MKRCFHNATERTIYRADATGMEPEHDAAGKVVAWNLYSNVFSFAVTGGHDLFRVFRNYPAHTYSEDEARVHWEGGLMQAVCGMGAAVAEITRQEYDRLLREYESLHLGYRVDEDEDDEPAS